MLGRGQPDKAHYNKIIYKKPHYFCGRVCAMRGGVEWIFDMTCLPKVLIFLVRHHSLGKAMICWKKTLLYTMLYLHDAWPIYFTFQICQKCRLFHCARREWVVGRRKSYKTKWWNAWMKYPVLCYKYYFCGTELSIFIYLHHFWRLVMSTPLTCITFSCYLIYSRDMSCFFGFVI